MNLFFFLSLFFFQHTHGYSQNSIYIYGHVTLVKFLFDCPDDLKSLIYLNQFCLKFYFFSAKKEPGINCSCWFPSFFICCNLYTDFGRFGNFSFFFYKNSLVGLSLDFLSFFLSLFLGCFLYEFVLVEVYYCSALI